MGERIQSSDADPRDRPQLHADGYDDKEPPQHPRASPPNRGQQRLASRPYRRIVIKQAKKWCFDL